MGFSFLHLLIIVLILVVLFGPNKIPKIGKSLGEGVRSFKKALSEEPEIDVTPSIKNHQVEENHASDYSQEEDRADSASSKKEKTTLNKG